MQGHLESLVFSRLRFCENRGNRAILGIESKGDFNGGVGDPGLHISLLGCDVGNIADGQGRLPFLEEGANQPDTVIDLNKKARVLLPFV